MQQDPAKKTDTEQLRRILTSAEGRQLLALLQQKYPGLLQRAAAMLQGGDAAGVQRLLSPVMETEEVQALLARLNR